MSGPLSVDAWRIEKAKRSLNVHQGLEVGAGTPDSIRPERASLAYGHGKSRVEALSQTTLRITVGNLVGPSGCGNFTILKPINGLLYATSGHVLPGGREVGAHDTRVGMAFQNPTLLPWLNIRKNVMLPLKTKGSRTAHCASVSIQLTLQKAAQCSNGRKTRALRGPRGTMLAAILCNKSRSRSKELQ